MNQLTLIPAPQEWAQMMQMGETLVKSGLLPQSIKTKETAVAIMLKGRELRIPPMQAFAKISIINGKPAMDAELMLALIYRDCPSAEVEILENTATGAKVRGRRKKDAKWDEFSFTSEDAERARLLGKDVWRNYPKAMFLWRAISAMARALFPDCLMGCSHTPEELGANVDGDGNVIDAEFSEQATPEPTPEPGKNSPEKKPLLYDDSFGQHQDAIAERLMLSKVDKSLWPLIGKKLHGRPFTDLRAATDEVMVEVTNRFEIPFAPSEA